MKTHKLIPAFSIGLLAVAAITTSATAVAGIERENNNSIQPRFVLNKSAKLKEGPAVMSSSLFTPNRYLSADAGEILQHNTATSVFGELNKRLGNTVVGVTVKIGLVPAQPTQNLLGSSSASTLKSSAGLGMALTNDFYCLSRVNIPIRVSGQVYDTKIDAKKVFHVNGRTFGHIDSRHQVELSLPGDEVNLTFDAIESLFLVLSEHVGEDFTPPQQPQRDVVQSLPRQDAFVVGDGAVRLKDGAASFVALERLDCLADRTNRHLSREAVFLSQVEVAPFVNCRLADNSSLKPNPRSMVGSLVEPRHRRQEEMAIVTGEQLNLKGQFHAI